MLNVAAVISKRVNNSYYFSLLVDNLTIESGENAQTRCLNSILIMKKKFVLQSNSISFDYRVDGRKCFNRYFGCDGLGFFINGLQVMDYVGSNFQWNTFNTNVSAVSTLFFYYSDLIKKICRGGVLILALSC